MYVFLYWFLNDFLFHIYRAEAVALPPLAPRPDQGPRGPIPAALGRAPDSGRSTPALVIDSARGTPAR